MHLGRCIHGFNQATWDREREQTLPFSGNYATVALTSQNETLRPSISDRLLAEAHACGSLWRIGLRADDDATISHSTWGSRHLLGHWLQDVR